MQKTISIIKWSVTLLTWSLLVRGGWSNPSQPSQLGLESFPSPEEVRGSIPRAPSPKSPLDRLKEYFSSSSVTSPSTSSLSSSPDSLSEPTTPGALSEKSDSTQNDEVLSKISHIKSHITRELEGKYGLKSDNIRFLGVVNATENNLLIVHYQQMANGLPIINTESFDVYNTGDKSVYQQRRLIGVQELRGKFPKRDNPQDLESVVDRAMFALDKYNSFQVLEIVPGTSSEEQSTDTSTLPNLERTNFMVQVKGTNLATNKLKAIPVYYRHQDDTLEPMYKMEVNLKDNDYVVYINPFDTESILKFSLRFNFPTNSGPEPYSNANSEATPSSTRSKRLSKYYGTWSSSLSSAIINAAGLQSAESASSFTILVKLTKDSESAREEISMTTPPKGDRPILHISDKVYHTLENTLGSKPHLREFVFHHELWHIVSNRLVGGAFNTECLLAGEAREIAEGLSDGLPTVTILASKTKQAFVELPSLKTEVTTRLYKRKANDAFIHGQRHVWDSFKTPKDLIRYFTTYIVFDIYWEYANKLSHRSPKESGTSSTHGSMNQEIHHTVQLITTAMMYMPCQPTLKDMLDALLFAQTIMGHDDPCLVWRPFHEWIGDQLKTTQERYDGLAEQCLPASSHAIASA